MKRKGLPIFGYLLFLVAVVYLGTVDFSEKLEADVSSLLPQSDSEAALLARRLISEEQGRSVYLELAGLPEDLESLDAISAKMVERLGESSWIKSVVAMEKNANFRALKFVNENRLLLLFPRWLGEKRKQFSESEDAGLVFSEWATEAAVQEMDTFLESTEAMQLARPEIMDPLLLSVGALLSLSEGSGSDRMLRSEDSGALGRRLFWVTLAESPLLTETQDAMLQLFESVESELLSSYPDVSMRYGGLVKLAAASRTRIQGDVFKINLLSVLGVVLVASVLMRRPWRLLWAVPTLLAGVVGALAVSFLVFDRVNVIVLVIGSILIGTTIDYAIHLILKDRTDDSFPTGKLVAYACLSTVVGFSILLFADLALIRQIGVFVGAGLVSAYLMAWCSIGGGTGESSGDVRDWGESRFGRRLSLIVSLVILCLGGIGLRELSWKDDVRNLEAPDEEQVAEDIALRGEFGSTGRGSVFLNTGGSYLEVLEREDEVLSEIEERFPAASQFGFSRFLPNTSQVAGVAEEGDDELVSLFDSLEAAFSEAGYESEEFDSFFSTASKLVRESGFSTAVYEKRIQEFTESLVGPMTGALGVNDTSHWSLSSVDLGGSESMEIVEALPNTTLFSQLSFLNDTLEEHRGTLFRFGALAMLLVAIAILFLFGLKKGSMIILYPILGGVVAVGVSSLLFEHLNLFHLVGCFLGGAIALDYALFSIEAFSRGVGIPHSVWLSAGTTTASFLALSASAIPVVQGLGTIVALLSCATLAMLQASQSTLSRIFRSNVTK